MHVHTHTHTHTQRLDSKGIKTKVVFGKNRNEQ